MKKIGQGMQYKAFLVNEDTVKKVPKSRFDIINILRLWYTSERDLGSLFRYGYRRRKESVERLKSSNLPLEDLFGIKRFEGDEVYQYRMRTVEDVMGEKDFEEIVDDYLDLIETLWRHGIGDTIYNFTINNGYRNGEMFQLDFGELVFEKSEVEEKVRNKKWLDQWSYTDQLNRSQKKIFRRNAAEKLTIERLNRVWNSEMK